MKNRKPVGDEEGLSANLLNGLGIEEESEDTTNLNNSMKGMEDAIHNLNAFTDAEISKPKELLLVNARSASGQ